MHAQLPKEIVLQILEEDLSFADLAACVLVCQYWRTLAQPLLYRDVALDASTLLVWTFKQGSAHHDPLIQSLTVRISPPPDKVDKRLLEANSEDGSAGHAVRALWKSTTQLTSRLANMTRLKSLSLICPLSTRYLGFWTNRPSIATLLENIPQTVRYLEIDLQGFEEGEDFGPTHLCPIIRRIIPQLQILHLRLQKVCPDLCGTGFDSSEPSTVSKDFQFVEIDKLEELVINVFIPNHAGFGSRSKNCGVRQVNSILDQAPLIEHLRALILARNPARLRRIWLLDFMFPQPTIANAYAAIVRRDVVTNQSCALPCKDFAGRVFVYNRSGYWIRMPESEGGMDHVTTFSNIWELAKGNPWLETCDGSRLPPVVRARSIRQPFAISSAEFMATYISKRIALWDNEARTGFRLVEVVNGGLMEQNSPREIIPPGWELKSGQRELVRREDG